MDEGWDSESTDTAASRPEKGGTKAGTQDIPPCRDYLTAAEVNEALWEGGQGGEGLILVRVGRYPLAWPGLAQKIKKKLPSLFGIWDLGFGISLASQPTKQHVHVHFLPPEANFRPDLAQFRPKTLAKWPKNLTKRRRFACKMAKKPYETQAFRM